MKIFGIVLHENVKKIICGYAKLGSFLAQRVVVGLLNVCHDPVRHGDLNACYSFGYATLFCTDNSNPSALKTEVSVSSVGFPFSESAA